MVAPAVPQPLQASVESTKVEYVRLGKSGLKVSVPILGAMSMGDPKWNSWVIEEEMVREPTSHPLEFEKQIYEWQP
jgi:hypothetical protein